MPARNEEEGIGRTLKAALAENPHEVIVVDGESEDGTAELARQAGCPVLSCSPGRASQQNAGAREASGDVLLFLHADSILPRGALEQIAEALAEPDIAGGAFCQRIEAGGILFRLLEKGNVLRVKWWGMAYGDQGIFLRRSVFDDLGGFADVRLMEDVLLMRELKRRRKKLVLLPGPLGTNARRWQRHGVVRQTLRNWMILAAERLGVSPDRLAEYYRPHWKSSRSR